MQLEIHAAETAHAERIGCRDALEPLRVHWNEERADPPTAHPRLRGGKQQHEVRGCGVRHPDLPPVQHVSAVVEPRDGLLVGGIRPGMLFGQRESADRLA